MNQHRLSHHLALMMILSLSAGCGDAPSSSGFRVDDVQADDAGQDEAAEAPDPEPTPDPSPDPTPEPPLEPEPDIPPETEDPPQGCPWALSGCFSMFSEMACGPFGCGVDAPTHLWIDALPCRHAPVGVHMDIEGWSTANPIITAQGHIGFNLAFEGAGQTFCVIELPDEHYYPDKVVCAQGDEALWEASLFENPSLCGDCPRLEGCYALRGLGEPHSVGLVQEGCAFEIIAEPNDGRTLQSAGSIGPTGNMIFRSVGQVADNVCALTVDEDLGLACAFTDLGMPTPLTLDPDVRLVPQSWDLCPSVGCLEDADCVDDPRGIACDFGRCVCSGRSPCAEGLVCRANGDVFVCVAP